MEEIYVQGQLIYRTEKLSCYFADVPVTAAIDGFVEIRKDLERKKVSTFSPHLWKNIFLL